MRTAVRWHVVEPDPGQYRFDSLDCILDAADESGVEVLLDILHFGFPDYVDLFARDFPERFADFAGVIARHLKQRGDKIRFVAPVNEISFLSWAGGEKAAIAPHTEGRGHELKENLIRACIAASNVLCREMPGVRLIAPEPMIHIVGRPGVPGDDEACARYTLAHFQAWDMLSGRLNPELGGKPEYLDIIGVNFYARNQWQHESMTALPREDPRWRPFHHMLIELWERYGRPLFVAETGTEDDARPDWFNYICDEVALAIQAGVPVHGICLYPIVNHPGWDDDRYCQNGLFDYAADDGSRPVYEPLAEALMYQQRRFEHLLKAHNEQQHRSDLFFSSPLGVRFPTASAHHEPVRPSEQGVLS